MQKLSCKKNRQLRARWKMRDAERAKARMPPVVTYTLNQFAWCSFSLPFSYFLIYCDLLMLIDDRLTEDPRMHRASYAFAEFHSLAAFFAHRKARWLHHGCIVILPGHSRGGATQGFEGLQCQLCRFGEFVWPLLVDVARIKILRSSEPRKRRSRLSTFSAVPVLCARIRTNASGCSGCSPAKPTAFSWPTSYLFSFSYPQIHHLQIHFLLPWISRHKMSCLSLLHEDFLPLTGEETRGRNHAKAWGKPRFVGWRGQVEVELVPRRSVVMLEVNNLYNIYTWSIECILNSSCTANGSHWIG